LGKYSRVPQDWRIPRCGVHDMWKMWWIGDDVQQIPRLRYLKNIEVCHLNHIPLSKVEMHRRTGKYKGNRRRSSKFLVDLKGLMKKLLEIVERSGQMAEVISVSSVDRMFDVIEGKINLKDRDLQKMWTTVAKELRTGKYDVEEN
jgi:hypothetical protein